LENLLGFILFSLSKPNNLVPGILISAVQSTCSCFSWIHCSLGMYEKSPLEETGSGLWMCVTNHTTGDAAKAVLCCSRTAENSSYSKQQCLSVPALCAEESTGYAGKPLVTLWRSGRKLPTKNISRGITILKEGRRKPCCGSACRMSALSLG